MSSHEPYRGSETPESLSAQKKRSNGQGDSDGDGPRSSRMDEALRLRQAMTNSSSYMNRKLLINQLGSPRREVANQFDDTDSDREADGDFAQASFKASGKSSENVEPSQGSLARKGFCRAGVMAKADVKCPTTPRSKASSTGNSVSSKVFQDQLSARFKSTSTAARTASGDSCEE